MALIVETGLGVPTANALVTRAATIAWAADFYPGTTVPDSTDTDGAILRASSWLSSYPVWEGEQTYGRGSQGLAIPRTGMTDCNGYEIASNVVPAEVQQATFLATLAEIVSPGVLTPTITPGERVKRSKVDVIEEEYMTPRDQNQATSDDPSVTLRPVLTAIRDLLKCMATFPDGKKAPWPWVA
jgi:hypothetical protein